MRERRVVVTQWMEWQEHSRKELWGQQRVRGLTTAHLRAQVSLDAALAEGIAAAKMALSALTASARGRAHFKERAERIRQEADRMYDTAAAAAAVEDDNASDGSDLAGSDDPPGSPAPGDAGR